MNKQIFNYDEAVSLLSSQKKFHINLGLERVQQLLNCFGNPQDNIKCAHVAGTNGKGSTCAMLASVLTKAGYKTGLYTSPHLLEYTERIQINNQEISSEDFAEIIFKVVNCCDRQEIPATEFEILTTAAFIYFFEQKVNIAIIETGLGGRLDATNIIKSPELSIITSIDLDHTARLGDSIEKIAYEKAGIIKTSVPVITLEDNKGLNVIKNKALKTLSPVFLTNYKDLNNIETGLKGLWQKKNLSLVLKAVDLLRDKGFAISEVDLKNGLKNAKWTGRFQFIENKNIIIDAAHNPSGAKALKSSLDSYFPNLPRIFIYSSLNTKDFKGVVKTLFEKNDRVIITKPRSSAAIEPEVIKNYIDKHKLCSESFLTQTTEEALKLYQQLHKNDDLMIFTGSIYTIGEFFVQNPDYAELI